ncbi:MAG: hypothetical protein HC882_07950 [Acidobacteria bacterium]|nr:hypothetical protein [Acidobacteriota bacterium]
MLHVDRPVLVSAGGGRLYGGRVRDAHLALSWTGRELTLRYEVVTRNMGRVVTAVASRTFVEPPEPRTLAQYGITLDPSPDQLEAVGLAGKRAWAFSESGSYLATDAVLEVPLWRDWVAVPESQGRIVVDQEGMHASDPNTFRAFNGLLDFDVGKPVAGAINDWWAVFQWLPAFSMRAKRWGRVHASAVSQIQFRTNALTR